MLFAAALLLVQTAPAQTGQTAPVCAAMDANLPAQLAAWTTPGQGDPGELTKPAVFKSMPLAEVAGVPADAKPGGATRVGFRIETAGNYGIALDQGGWIDVAPDGGAALVSVKHGHGPDCSTIRKIVRFDLKPGLYYLTLTGLTKPQAKVMLVKD